MIPIHKQPAPQSLADYKREGSTDYEAFPYKAKIRASLVAEQKGICAYCMGRISVDAMKIEHFKSQSYGMYTPYFYAAVGYLEKQLARAE